MIPPCFRGPDLAVVGWIPYFDRIKDLPAGHNYQASLAMHLLFNSGNAEPPDEFAGGYNEFLSWLHSRNDYRAALHISNVVCVMRKTSRPQVSHSMPKQLWVLRRHG